MAFTTLIDTATLAAHLSDPAFALIDCRYDLRDEAWGRREYEAAHIPGAAYASLDLDLSGEKTGRNGRHPLPDPESLAPRSHVPFLLPRSSSAASPSTITIRA